MIDYLMNSLIGVLSTGFLGFFELIVIIAISLVVLSKGADILVDEAVLLSERWGVPKMIIGATIVSLGTTLPEATVSVMSALKGAPGLAMGNAVGSIICDTGLILGIAALIKPLPFKKEVINRQGWIQLGSGVLLVITSFAFGQGLSVFKNGSVIPQFVGWVFLGLLLIYMVKTIQLARKSSNEKEGSVNLVEEQNVVSTSNEPTVIILLKLILGIALVILSSKILIPAVQETAVRFHIPENIIAATLVAFGTSLPELTTAIASTRKGHGDLAIGNVMGADILNVLFVVGAAASVTPQGLAVQSSFFILLFPAMLFVLCVFKGAVLFSKNTLKRPVGFVLLTTYVVVTILSYVTGF
jgi:cation:H+ antiporter